MGLFDFFKKEIPDWVSTNESDGAIFYGYDTGDGHTDWYDGNGNLDSSTDTPSDDDCDDNLQRF